MPSPVFLSATVDGDELVLNYNMALDAAHPPLAGAFAVTVEGLANAVTNVEVDGQDIILTLTTPVQEGDVVSLAYTDPTAGDDADAVQDAGGVDAGDIASSPVTNQTDSTAPTLVSLVLSDPDATLAVGETTTVTFTFSEAVVDFDDNDVVADHGTLTNFSTSDGGVTYTATYTATTIGSGTISAENAAFEDGNANPGTGDAAYFANITVQAAPPTLDISVTDNTLDPGETTTVTFEFSEEVDGFTENDIQVAGGTLSNFQQDNVDLHIYTATFTPTRDGNLEIKVNNSTFTAGGVAGVGDNVTLTADLVPSVEITAGDTSLTPGQTTTITFTFSEEPTGFDEADIVVNGGTLTDLEQDSIDPQVWTASFKADTVVGSASVKVSALSYDDATGNHGAADSLNMTIANPPEPDPDPTPNVPTGGNDVLTTPSQGGTVEAGTGADQVTGGTGSDVIQGNTGSDTISGGAGVDWMRGGQDSDLVNGDAGDDQVYGDVGDDEVHGGDDNDFVQGNTGTDSVFGDDGADTAHGGQGNDFLQGGQGADIVVGDVGDDVVHGGKGDDIVFGMAGADYLSGDLGNDSLVGGSGADTFSFGATSFGRDFIRDFSAGEGDAIHISPSLAANFTALTITADASGNAVITFGASTITLAGVAPSSLSAEDFLFG